jgi:hyperosmotically inducible periplasmic protein
MMTIRLLKFAGVALAAAVAMNAWPQASDSGTVAPAASSAGTMSKSAVRKANRALSRKVTQALQKGGVDTVGLNVIAKGGAVTLAGHAADASQIDKAASIAKGVSGVSSVKNVLTVMEGGQ